MHIYRGFIILVIMIYFFCNCNTSTTIKKENPDSPSLALENYFSQNMWKYPVSVDTSLIKYVDSAGNKNLSLFMFRNLYKWASEDSSIIKYHPGEAIRIHSIEMKEKNSLVQEMRCLVDFYTLGETADGNVIPIEGRSIVDNKFLRQREIGYFLLKSEKIDFLRWQN